MKFLVLSDLHANWWALQSVLKDAESQYDQVLCCGDIVGYNPRPREVLHWTRENCAAVIRGNHDKVVAGLEDLDWFNDVAQAAAIWTMDRLTPDELAYVRDLAKGPIGVESFQLCHGSPLDEDEYIVSAREAGSALRDAQIPLTFFGHTHVQGGFFLQGGQLGMLPTVEKTRTERILELQPNLSYLINPGSVGQPRDSDPRAAYVIYNEQDRTVAYRRVEYAVEETAREIREAGLPDVLGYRLFRGL
ncbi:MAG: metallophosphoesterase family protein [Bryobacteraceae bacterium]